MTMTEEKSARSSVFERIEGTRDALTVKRVFGDPVELDGATVIPVAAVRGAGGGGEGTGPDSGQQSGSGAGMGFAVNSRPLGVYVVKGGEVEWRPALDVMRIVLASQAAALVGMAIILRLLRRRAKH